MASRSGQKGVIGLVIPEQDMPFTKDGLRPDLIINPHAIPSRMTIGQLVECIVGKACLLAGAHGDCTAFNNRGSKIALYGEHLTKHGYNSTGNEILYNGMTGEQLEMAIFIGPTYYMRLKHMVKDKINFRARGPNTALTRQPVSGRANDGGLRIGEMERDVLVSYGMTNMLTESMMERADKYSIAICNQSGMISIYNPAKNIFISPMVDGPIQYISNINSAESQGGDEPAKIKHVTQYGRDFSILNVPYSFKLFIQELQTMNVQMRIITDKNIEQLESLMFSKNTQKLIGNKYKVGSSNISQILTGAYKEVIGSDRYDKWQREHKKELKLKTGGGGSATGNDDADDDDDKSFSLTEIIDTKSPTINVDTGAADDDDDDDDDITIDDDAYNSADLIDINEFENSAENFNTLPSDTLNKYNSQKTDTMFSPADDNDFSIGETIYYRGDIKPKREWKIKKKGKTFYTIETEDAENIPDKQERIKIVLPMDIYKPVTPLSTTMVLDSILPILNTDKTSHTIMMQQPGNGFNLGSAAAAALMYENQQQQQQNPVNNGIQVNPIIKIINGPDNSIGAGDADGCGVAGEHGATTVYNPNPMFNTLNMANGNGANANEISAESSPANNEIDFSKGNAIIVKKI